jgi:uroporphyrin-III C-methyltransferase
MNQRYDMTQRTPGKVYLIGAGPGDPELLTVKAVRLLEAADAVLHDDLVAPQVLAYASASALVRDVGKRCGTKTISQHEINQLMIAFARAGMNVVRLKSGDPLIFGRAGEEIEALEAAGVEFEVVPGVTAAFAAAAAAQVSLTQRKHASAVVFVTNHRYRNDAETNWKALVDSGATLAIYMPGSDYAAISSKLRLAGLDPQTPCVIVSNASKVNEEIHATSVANLDSAPSLAAPALLLVGSVAHRAVSRITPQIGPPQDLSEVSFNFPADAQGD